MKTRIRVTVSLCGRTYYLKEDGRLTKFAKEAYKFGDQLIAESCAAKIGRCLLPFFSHGHVRVEDAP